jgi:hypothetical protein
MWWISTAQWNTSAILLVHYIILYFKIEYNYSCLSVSLPWYMLSITELKDSIHQPICIISAGPLFVMKSPVCSSCKLFILQLYRPVFLFLVWHRRAPSCQCSENLTSCIESYAYERSIKYAETPDKITVESFIFYKFESSKFSSFNISRTSNKYWPVRFVNGLFNCENLTPAINFLF